MLEIWIKLLKHDHLIQTEESILEILGVQNYFPDHLNTIEMPQLFH